MKINVEIPDGQVCKICIFITLNSYDVNSGYTTVQAYCRLIRKVWKTDLHNVFKHHDCPAYPIEQASKGEKK